MPHDLLPLKVSIALLWNLHNPSQIPESLTFNSKTRPEPKLYPAPLLERNKTMTTLNYTR